MKNNYHITVYISIIFLVFNFLLCEDNKAPISIDELSQRIKTNFPPTIKELKSSSREITVCDTLNLLCDADDPDNDSLAYEWISFKLSDASTIDVYQIIKTLFVGNFLNSGKSVLWKPGILKGKYLIISKVTDTAGYESSEEVVINVTHKLCKNIQMLFSIQEVNGLSLAEFRKYVLKILPTGIIITQSDDNYSGHVELENYGLREIKNFPESPQNGSSFYIEIDDIYNPGDRIIFSELQITKEMMTGYWIIFGSTWDVSPNFFEAWRL